MEARRAYTEDVRKSLAASLQISKDPDPDAPLRVLHSALIQPDGVLLKLDASIEFGRGGDPAKSFLSCLLLQIEPFTRRLMSAAVQSVHADGRTTDLLTVPQLLQMLRGVSANIRLNGFYWHGRERPDYGNILHQCMLRLREHEPVRSLIPGLVELVESLLNQPSNRSESVDHPMGKTHESALLLLFQRNPCIHVTLLPMVMLLRKYGANPNHVAADGGTLWDVLSNRLTAGKIDFLLRWLLAEADLSVFDFVSTPSTGPCRRSRLDKMRERKKGLNHTPQQIYCDIIERMAADQMRRQTIGDSSSRVTVDVSANEESQSIRVWLQEQLAALPRRLFSTRVCNQLRAPYNLFPYTSPLELELTPAQVTRRHDLITELIAAIAEQPELVRLYEVDEDGYSLLTCLLTLPTVELMRFEPHAAWLFTSISELDPITLRTNANIRGPAPLDLLFVSHRPHERGDFIWRLSDALLAKALELSPPQYLTVDSLLSCIGSPRTWWLRLLTSQPHRADGGTALASAAGSRPELVFLPMRRVRLVLELLDSHGVHRCPATNEDFYAILLQFTQLS
jgi:hypothetical protein